VELISVDDLSRFPCFKKRSFCFSSLISQQIFDPGLLL
jgi:hypothetical protein